MAQLKSVDILGELAGEQADAPEDKPEAVVEPKLDQAGAAQEDLAKRKQNAKKSGAGKPSPYQADLREKLRQKQQFNLGLCPTFIVKEFERLSKKSKMNKREFFYHMLREAGADIPPYKEMDGRKL